MIRYRRHGDSYSDGADQARELDEVERAPRAAPRRTGRSTTSCRSSTGRCCRRPGPSGAPARCWPTPSRPAACPTLAATCSASAPPATADGPFGPARRPNGKRIVLTSYGFEDAGGGTIVPRYLAKELAQRGWDVTVFHAAVRRIDGAGSYAVREWEQDGVKLVGVFNRPHVLLDLGHPLREVDDPPIAEAFAQTLDRVQPDVVHFHNLHNLGVSLVDETAVRGIPTLFSTHNYWLHRPAQLPVRGRPRA